MSPAGSRREIFATASLLAVRRLFHPASQPLPVLLTVPQPAEKPQIMAQSAARKLRHEKLFRGATATHFVCVADETFVLEETWRLSLCYCSGAFTVFLGFVFCFLADAIFLPVNFASLPFVQNDSNTGKNPPAISFSKLDTPCFYTINQSFILFVDWNQCLGKITLRILSGSCRFPGRCAFSCSPV